MDAHRLWIKGIGNKIDRVCVPEESRHSILRLLHDVRASHGGQEKILALYREQYEGGGTKHLSRLLLDIG